MVIVSVLYPNVEGSKFDHDYYREQHLPLVRRLLEPAGMRAFSYYEPVKTDPTAPYQMVAELRFDTMEITEAALAEHGPITQADIPNFTDVTPTILIGEEIEA